MLQVLFYSLAFVLVIYESIVNLLACENSKYWFIASVSYELRSG